MGDFDVIDRFMAAFTQYIDSGFGLLRGDVAFLTTTLVGMDVDSGRPLLGNGR